MSTPTGVPIGRYPTGSPEWHEARAKGIGGSEIATILGLSPYDSRFALWHRKRGEIGQVEETPAMEWGNRLEDAVICKWVDEHGRDVLTHPGTYCHKDRPWQIANPDGLTIDGDVEVIEAKTSHVPWAWGPSGGGGGDIPVHYLAQTIWYLDTLGLQRAHVAVLIDGYDWRQYVVEHDEAEARMMRDAAKDFLDSIDLGERPDIDGSTSTYEAVRELHPDIDGTEIETHLAADYAEAIDRLRDAQERKRLTASRLADVMATAQYATYLGDRFVRRQSRNGGTPYLTDARKKDR